MNMDIRIQNKSREFFNKVGAMFPQYDFSEFEYTGCRNKSIVICPEHGRFTIHANSLYQAKKHPCPECNRQNRLLPVNELIQKLNSIHNNKYKYDTNSIKGAGWHCKIKIKCKVHGWFTQEKGSHLHGCGCPACYEKLRSTKSKDGINQYYKNNKHQRFNSFIEKALKVHGDRYDYSNVVYSNSHTEICIVCPDHGEFYQKPFQHLQSNTGCTFCALENLNFDYVQMYENTTSGKEIGTFYKLLFTHIPTGIKFIKIGITKNTVEQRYSKGYDNFSYEIIKQVQDTNLNCAIEEQKYKNTNVNNRFILPSSIKFTGHSECYCWDNKQQLKAKGISFLRDSLLEKQGGVCGICGKIPVRPVLDHDHKKRVKGTSMCRGTLCSSCNIMLAKVENNAIRYGFSQKELPDILRKVAQFKEATQTLFIHPSEAPKTPILTKRSYGKLSTWYLKHYKGRAKFPKYRVNKKDKPKQTLTKTFVKWFELAGIEPTFYGDNK